MWVVAHGLGMVAAWWFLHLVERIAGSRRGRSEDDWQHATCSDDTVYRQHASPNMLSPPLTIRPPPFFGWKKKPEERPEQCCCLCPVTRRRGRCSFWHFCSAKLARNRSQVRRRAQPQPLAISGWNNWTQHRRRSSRSMLVKHTVRFKQEALLSYHGLRARPLPHYRNRRQGAPHRRA